MNREVVNRVKRFQALAKSLIRYVPMSLCRYSLLTTGYWLLATGFPAIANDGYVGSIGQTAYPLTNKDIVMEREKVVIEDLGGEAKVECHFWFKNITNRRLEVEMGFPEEDRNFDQQTDLAVIRDFAAWVDGKPVEVAEKSAVENKFLPEFGKYSRWFTWKVEFSPNQKRFVSNTYRIYESADNSGGWGYFYVLKTGSLWAGKLGKSEIYFKTKRFPLAQGDLTQPGFERFIKDLQNKASRSEDAIAYVELRPKNWKMKEVAVVWEFENFEPKEDIGIYVSPWPAFYNEVLKKFPDTPLAKRALLAEITQNPPAVYGKDRLELIETFLSSFPGDAGLPEILLGYAYAYKEMGDSEEKDPKPYFEKAEEYFRRAVEIHPDRDGIEHVYSDFGWFYLYSTEEAEKALKVFQSGLPLCRKEGACMSIRQGILSSLEALERWLEAKNAAEELLSWAKEHNKATGWIENKVAVLNGKLSQK